MSASSIITAPAYIVIDIPSPMAEKIRSLRARFDSPRASLPVEITLTGSCGVGLITLGQELDAVAAEMDRIAAEYAPFQASFEQVERFSNTDIYFLTVRENRPFEVLNKAFAWSKIKFELNSFPYKPHCTLKLRSTPSEQELFELLFLDPPQEGFTLNTFSLYSLQDANSCELLHKVELTGRHDPNDAQDT